MEGFSHYSSSLSGSSLETFMTLIHALFATSYDLDTKKLYPRDYSDRLRDGEEFDFIVVGGGSAGSMVASRLSEISTWKILLIEAGGYPSTTTEVPGLYESLRNTAEDWSYKMEPSGSYCTGLIGNVCPCPRGKGLGGSSLINNNLYVRSTRYDHDKWSKAGNVGWEYDSMVPHYRTFENVALQDGNYGKHGDLKISPKKTDWYARAIQEALQEFGYESYSLEKPTGYYQTLATISNGTRQSSSKAFLTKAKDRPNLFVVLNAQVGKVIFDATKTRAAGVQVKISGKIVTVKARKEVVLSAGAINSPQILMNSGVGPKGLLEKIGVEVVKDLPVGENYQDHAAYTAFYADIDEVQPRTNDDLDNIYQYFAHKTGPLEALTPLPIAFVNTQSTSKDYANFQIVTSVFPPASSALAGLLQEFVMPIEVRQKVIQHNAHKSTVFMIIVQLHPKSRGCVTIKTADPYDRPSIIPRFWSDPQDLDEMLTGIEAAKNILNSNSLRKYNPRLIELELKGCNFPASSEKYWRCAIKSLGQTMYHPVGTCKMGPRNDPSAVVDPQLRVRGVLGLRVVDASVMPTIPSGNTNAPTIMVGSKGAEIIREE